MHNWGFPDVLAMASAAALFIQALNTKADILIVVYKKTRQLAIVS
jgi:hypothetical protein